VEVVELESYWQNTVRGDQDGGEGNTSCRLEHPNFSLPIINNFHGIISVLY
jgi:hypothetical protein